MHDFFPQNAIRSGSFEDAALKKEFLKNCMQFLIRRFYWACAPAYSLQGALVILLTTFEQIRILFVALVLDSIWQMALVSGFRGKSRGGSEMCFK